MMHRPALRGAGHSQRSTRRRSTDLRGRSSWTLVGVGVTAGRPVVQDRVVLPGVPQPGDGVEELVGPVVALRRGRGVLDRPKFCASLSLTEVTTFHAARPPGQVVEGGEGAGDVDGL